jgi:hypothetical protein
MIGNQIIIVHYKIKHPYRKITNRLIITSIEEAFNTVNILDETERVKEWYLENCSPSDFKWSKDWKKMKVR